LQPRDQANLSVLLRLGQISLLSKDFAKGVEWLQKAKDFAPWDAEISAWLGRAYFQKGDLGKSLKEFRSARILDPSPEIWSIWNAEALASANLYNDAIKILEREVARDPMRLHSMVALARIKLDQPDWDLKRFWVIRKDLQLVLSRLNERAKLDGKKAAAEFEVSLVSTAEIKEQTVLLLKLVERRLAGNPNS